MTMSKHIVAVEFKTRSRKFAPAPKAKPGEPQRHAFVAPADIDGPVSFADWKRRGFIIEMPKPDADGDRKSGSKSAGSAT